ncbi:MAG: helix-turn-helix domain-containing protein [Planctomycetes bacterium]|nr:helix-turn-helix domain-containing protein [Planctomycetota bacterium]
MIRNAEGLAESHTRILEFRARLKRLKRKHVSKGLADLQAHSIRKALRDVEDQVRLYEEALAGHVNQALFEKLLSPANQKGQPNVGAAIFILRTAHRVTQAELARRLGTKRESIARWEREDYGQYTLETLQKIFEALGFQITLHVRARAG